MTVPSKPVRVVAIGDPGSTLQQINTALSVQEEFQLIDILGTPDKLVREIRAASPNIILVDYEFGGQPTLDILDEIASQFPEIAIIAILPGEDPVRAQQVMLAGARAFLIQPFTQINLLSTLRRVRDLEMRRVSMQSGKAGDQVEIKRPLRTLAVFSPRGGVGCSTLAANLALVYKEETDHRVLLLEGKLFFGHLHVLLNLRTQNTLADLIPHSHNLDEGLITEVVAKHVSGLHVLLAPADFQISQGIRPDDLYNVLVGVQRFYDLIVIDAGSSLTENTVTLLDGSDRLMLVTNPDLVSLHDTSRFLQISHTLAYPPEKHLIVLNRAGLTGGIKQRDIEASLHYQLYAQIPDDEDNALRSLNRGIPLVTRYPRSQASRAIKQLSKSISEIVLTEVTPGGPPPAVERAHQDALLASSRLG
jgi:pilus assembly protein CpaE